MNQPIEIESEASTAIAPDMEGFKLHADSVVIQSLYPLLRKAELEYGIERNKSAVYVADQVMNLLAVYLGVDLEKIDRINAELGIMED